MANAFDKLRGIEFPKGRDIPEVDPFADIDIEQIKADLAARDTRWDFVEAATAMWGNKELMANMRRLRTSVAENPTRDQVARAAKGYIEQFVLRYRAGRNVEPIGVYSYCDDAVVKYLCEKVANALIPA